MTKKSNPPLKSKRVTGASQPAGGIFQVFLILLLGGSSLFFLPGLLERYVSSRFTFASAVMLWGSILLFQRAGTLKNVSLRPLDLVLLLFYVIQVAGVFYARNVGEAIFTAQKSSLVFGAYVMMRIILEQYAAAARWMLQITTALSVILLCLLVGQVIYYAGSQGLSNEALYAVSGAMGNKSLAAEYLYMLLPFQLMAIMENKSSPHYRWYICLPALSMIMIGLLQVRTVYAALLIFLLAAAYSLFPFLRRWSWRRWLALGAGACVVFASLVFLFKAEGSWNSILERINPVNYLQSGSVAERRYVWYRTRELIADHWWTGVGTGNWKIEFPSKGLSGAYRLQEQNVVFTRTHNDYLEVWAETGMIGLISYLAIFAVAIGTSIAMIRKFPRLRSEMGLLLAALAGYGLISFFDFPKERIEHQMLLSLTFAWIARWDIAIPMLQGFSLYSRGRRLLFAGIAVGMLCNLIIGYYRIKGDKASFQILSNKNNWPRAIGYAQSGASVFYTVDPTVIPLKWYEGLAYSQMQQPQKAVESFREAYAITPFAFQVISNYASSLAANGDCQTAIPLFHKALEINPKFEDGIFNLSFCLVRNKAWDEAIDWLEKVEKDSVRRDAYIQQIRSEKAAAGK